MSYSNSSPLRCWGTGNEFRREGTFRSVWIYTGSSEHQDHSVGGEEYSISSLNTVFTVHLVTIHRISEHYR